MQSLYQVLLPSKMLFLCIFIAQYSVLLSRWMYTDHDDITLTDTWLVTAGQEECKWKSLLTIIIINNYTLLLPSCIAFSYTHHHDTLLVSACISSTPDLSSWWPWTLAWDSRRVLDKIRLDWKSFLPLRKVLLLFVI